ncbi:MAG: SDR family oxidoreductase [Elusimicrobia bacterium]|nr:SDR family oxidoreductase [Elusimicrobiota bacterium]
MAWASPFRNDLVKDKVALVTGGGTGICFGIAKALGSHGARLILMGRRQDVLEKAQAELAGENIECAISSGDVRRPRDAARAVEQVSRFGALHILVNGAAGNFLCSAEDLSYAAFKAVMDIDLLGSFNMCQAAFPALRSHGGVILNISTTFHYGATPLQTHASAAKAGVDALTRSLACEWGKHGIRVCGIAPGPIAGTEGMRRLAPFGVKQKLKETVPLGRLGTIEDIATAALYLCSDAASYVTGETLVVDGGHWLAKPALIPWDLYERMKNDRQKQ